MPTFHEGQTVYVQATVHDPEPDHDGEIQFRGHGDDPTGYDYALPSKCFTAEDLRNCPEGYYPAYGPDVPEGATVRSVFGADDYTADFAPYSANTPGVFYVKDTPPPPATEHVHFSESYGRTLPDGREVYGFYAEPGEDTARHVYVSGGLSHLHNVQTVEVLARTP